MASCLKNFEDKHTSENGPTIPFDFQWGMTTDAALTVGLPSVDGKAPAFALVKVYSSPALNESNLLAEGMVDAKTPTLRAAFTMPRGVDNIYVQMIIPDGSRATKMVPVTGAELSVSGIRITPAKSQAQLAITAQALAESALEPKASSMVIPVTESIPTTYDVTISQNPSSPFAIGQDNKSTYLIPSGVTIDRNIDMTTWTQQRPTLYVAGRLEFKSTVNVELSRLVVLDGGEVVIDGELSIYNQFEDQASVYVCEGGALTAKTLFFKHGKNGVMANEGELYLTHGKVKMTGGKLYTTTGINSGSKGKNYEPVDVTEASYAEIHNDGPWHGGDIVNMDASSVFSNYENGDVTLKTVRMDAMTLNQRGKFYAEDVKYTNRVVLNNYCHTAFKDFEANQSTVNNASGALLAVTQNARLHQSTFNLAAMSIIDLGLLDKISYASTFVAPTTATDRDGAQALVLIKKSEYKDKWNPMLATGLVEIVCAEPEHFRCSNGATLVEKQTMNIPASDCNGGVGQITPAPVDPENEYDTKGAIYTYCFEDGWPWCGDYDMNDLVVEMRVDRKTKNGKVEAIRINWEARASGAENTIACALMLDRIPTVNIASVSSTHQIGSGEFVVEGGLERDNDYAVVPLFNRVSEVLGQDNGFINTVIGEPKVPTVKHSTEVTFTTPVESDMVTESALNFFLVVGRKAATVSERWREIHLPSFEPTKHAIVTGFNTIYDKMPYKYYTQGPDTQNNGLMWGLRIPGVFRYPSELSDIRQTYKEFLPWATSGGTTHPLWYEGEVVEENIYK